MRSICFVISAFLFFYFSSQLFSKNNNKVNDRVLITSYSLKVGGVQRALVSMLSVFPCPKEKIDLFLTHFHYNRTFSLCQ